MEDNMQMKNQIKMEEIFKCCKFIDERIEKEIDIIEPDFYSEDMIEQEIYNDLLFFQFKKILLKETDSIKEEYLFIFKRIIIAFKELKQFQNVQFDLQSKNNINYTKF